MMKSLFFVRCDLKCAGFFYFFPFPFFVGGNTLAKEAPENAAVGKRALEQEKENNTPPKRPKSAEEKTLTNEQVSYCFPCLNRCSCLYAHFEAYKHSYHGNHTCL